MQCVTLNSKSVFKNSQSFVKLVIFMNFFHILKQNWLVMRIIVDN